MYIRTILIVSSAFFVLTRAETSPYDLVSKCSPALLAPRLVGFDISEVANNGNYTLAYLVQASRNIKCATGMIYGDNVIGYKGSYVYTQNDGSTITTFYSLAKFDKGVIDEVLTLTDADGTKTTYEFRLIVNKWNKDVGVLYLTRCSEFGTGSSDIRSILILDCFYNRYDSRIYANQLAKDDAKFGYKGEKLQPVQRCPSRFK